MTVPALRSILAIVFVAALVGCAAPTSIKTYEGQQLPVENAAVLLVDRQIFVSDVGDFKTGITFVNKEKSMEGTQFEIKPGRQKIVFRFYSFSSSSDVVGVPTTPHIATTTYRTAVSAPIEISHDFIKGHKYELHYRPVDQTFQARIVDVTTGGSLRGYAVAWGRL